MEKCENYKIYETYRSVFQRAAKIKSGSLRRCAGAYMHIHKYTVRGMIGGGYRKSDRHRIVCDSQWNGFTRHDV